MDSTKKLAVAALVIGSIALSLAILSFWSLSALVPDNFKMQAIHDSTFDHDKWTSGSNRW